MTKLTISNPAFGCNHDSVEVEIFDLSLRTESQSGVSQSFPLRVFSPGMVDGKYHYLEDLARRLTETLEQSEGEEREFWEWLLLMATLYDPSSKIDRKRERRFDVETFRFHKYKRLKELATSAGVGKLGGGDLLKRISGNTDVPTSKLVHDAVYTKPVIELPVARKHYEAFRDSTLSELCESIPMFEEIVSQARTEVRKQISNDPKLSSAEREELLRKFDSQEPPSLHDIWPIILERAQKLEAETAAKFKDLVDEARALHDEVGALVESRGITEQLAQDGESFTPQYAECIRDGFNPRRANDLFERLLRRFREVYSIGEVFRVLRHTDDLPVELEQYVQIECALRDGDVFDKWCVIGWVLTQLEDRNELVRLMQREAEEVWLALLDYAHKMIYRKIRHGLTRCEKRAFVFMYFRQPSLGGRIAIADPIVMSFYDGMDDETRGLIQLVLFHKVREFGGTQDMAEELERRWRAYLHVYPHWVEIVQDEDRNSKRQRRRGKVLICDRGAIIDSRVAGTTEPFASLVLAPRGLLEKWVEQFCDSKERTYLMAAFYGGKTQAEIADEAGVSQAAISKSIRSALLKLRKGLESRGYRWNGNRLEHSVV